MPVFQASRQLLAIKILNMKILYMMGEVSVLTGIDVNPYISAFRGRGIYGITSILELN